MCQFTPQKASPKSFPDPVTSRPENLLYHSRLVNLCFSASRWRPVETILNMAGLYFTENILGK